MPNGPPEEFRGSVIITLVSLKATNLLHCFATQWQKGTLCFFMEGVESCCFCNQRNEMDSSFLYTQRLQKHQKMRFKVQVCSDTGGSTEILDVPIQRRSDFISGSSLSPRQHHPSYRLCASTSHLQSGGASDTLPSLTFQNTLSVVRRNGIFLDHRRYKSPNISKDTTGKIPLTSAGIVHA